MEFSSSIHVHELYDTKNYKGCHNLALDPRV